MSSGPGYAKHPEHSIETRPAKERVQVKVGGEVIADSTDAIALYEAGRGPTWYLPRADVKMDRLERTTHRSHCPFKGDASYFTIKNAPRGENAVWSYEQPIDEVRSISERLAFYPDRVDSIEAN
ncbi:MAG: DUF427 domain-containing protein [Burkholderiales bacterium]